MAVRCWHLPDAVNARGSSISGQERMKLQLRVQWASSLASMCHHPLTRGQHTAWPGACYYWTSLVGISSLLAVCRGLHPVCGSQAAAPLRCCHCTGGRGGRLKRCQAGPRSCQVDNSTPLQLMHASAISYACQMPQGMHSMVQTVSLLSWSFTV